MKFMVVATAIAGACFGAMIAPDSVAQVFPNKTVRVIVPTAPGGGIDVSCRIVTAKLQEYWGQPVIVENRPGAAMVIGAELAAKSAPDGYTLFVAHDGAMAMNPVVIPALSYDPQRDFAPISVLVAAPLVVMVHPSTGLSSIQSLIAYAKANPGKLNHASGGTASLLALELFNALAGTQITPISYKGAGPALSSLMAGETQIAFADIGSGASTLKSGRVRVLGIATLERSKLYPEVPTIDESGVPKFETSTWVAMFAPAATPREITERIGNDVRRALADPDVRQRYQAINFEVIGSTAEGLTSMLRRDTEKWGRLVRERNLKFSQ
jgi:tripartite-type tricarboxylate transporter receptor subunit TctC